MKCPNRLLPWILFALVLIAVGRAPAATAWQALDVLKSERGAGALRSVTQVRGHRGQDQPREWEVVTRLADGERVYVMQGGRIVADTIYSSSGGVTVDMRRLRVDSGEVFTIANRAATGAKVGFDAIDYELRAAAHGNAPLWIIHLRDDAGRDVGRLEVSGEDGQVTKKEWFEARDGERQPIGPEPSPDRKAVRTYQPTPAPASGPGQAVWQRTTAGIGGAGQKVKAGFRSVGDSFSRIFRGQATYQTRDEARYQKPATVKRGP